MIVLAVAVRLDCMPAVGSFDLHATDHPTINKHPLCTRACTRAIAPGAMYAWISPHDETRGHRTSSVCKLDIQSAVYSREYIASFLIMVAR